MLRRAILPFPLTATLLALVACGMSSAASAAGDSPSHPARRAAHTATPIKHLVIIYAENVSFDHYFGTYPKAANPAGEPAFKAAAGTPAVKGLTRDLLTHNPNVTNASNIAQAQAANPPFPANDLNPFRIDRAQANTADQNHAYTPEQSAAHNGLMDAFPANTGIASKGGAGAFGTVAQVMGYFDGNTVTALWNYAQRFAMNDNAYTDTYGPSTPGALEIVAGTTNGAVAGKGTAKTIPDGQGGLTLINDTDPVGDVCSSANTVLMTSKNIGDLLNAKGISWGGFMGGFNLQTTNKNGTTGCTRSTYSNVMNTSPTDYIAHHNWFQYYTSTANLQHTRPSSIAAIGASTETDGKTPEPANHQYDVDDFYAAVSAGNFPAVSYIKAPAIGDGHPVNSNPLDEQAFNVKMINFLQQQPDWKNTAVILTYDDSDGWYDHRFGKITSASLDPTADTLNGPGTCSGPGVKQPMGLSGKPVNGRCGPGTRIPFLVISPWARVNFVDDTLISQASILRFIEDNWLGKQRIGQGSFDATAGSLMKMFNFTSAAHKRPLFLDAAQGTKLPSAPKAEL
jgi:phospholipase C